MRSRYARIFALSPATVKEFRNDFLTLVGNVKRVKDYDDAQELRNGIRDWRELFSDWLKQIRSDIESRKRDVPGKTPVPEQEIEAILAGLKPAWELSTELMRFPLQTFDPETAEWQSKSRLFTNYTSEVEAWDKRVKKKAPVAWKALENASTWATQWGDEAIKVKVKETQNITIEGFRIQLNGFEDGDLSRDFMSQLVEGLRFYRDRAKRVLPLLLSKQLPLVINADWGSNGGDAAATYEQNHIALSPWGHATKDLRAFAHVMAHEMGHHIYRTVLSSEAKTDWSTFIKGGEIPLDLRDLAKALAKYGDNPTVIDDKLREQDPILALQFEGLMEDRRYKDLDLFNLRGVQEYLTENKDPVVYVSRMPITGYAQKNPEEAFCEVLGLLVGYGPKTVLPEVVGFLQGIIPSIRLGSRISTESGLRSATIRLAHKNPDLRPLLLPLLR